MWNDSGSEDHLCHLLEMQNVIHDSIFMGILNIGLHLELWGRFVADQLISLSATKEACNFEMSRIRIAVEWGFALNVNYWGINNYKKGSKIMSSLLAAYFIAPTLFTNFYTCIKVKILFQRSLIYHHLHLKSMYLILQFRIYIITIILNLNYCL
jgi:hypothetical protein